MAPIVPTRILEPGMRLLDILADGSKVLATKPATNDEIGRGTLWTASLLGGVPRKLSDRLAGAARWSPDGHSIVYYDRSALYWSDADGEHLRKDMGGARRFG